MQLRVRGTKKKGSIAVKGKVQKQRRPEAKRVKATVTAAPVQVADKAIVLAAQEQRLVQQNSNTVLAQAKLLRVEDDETQTSATNLLLSIKDLLKQVKEKQDFVVRPLNEHVKRLRGMFKPTIDQLETADRELRKKVLDYRSLVAREAERKQAKMMEKAEEQLEAGDQEAAQETAVEALAVQGPERVMNGDAGQVTTQRPWVFEVEDAGAVPREYLLVDEKAIRKAVQAGARNIPGVRIYQTERLAVGGL